MRKGYYVFGIILLVSLLMMSGCQNKGYSKKQAENIMTEFIKEKYGDTPQFEWIRWYNKENRSQGYYALTTEGYYIRMNVFTEQGEDPKYRCLDTREYGEIAEALEATLADNPVSAYFHVEINPIDDDSQEKLWDSLRDAYEQKWDGDLENFLIDSSQMVYRAFLYEGSQLTRAYITIRPDSLTDYVSNYDSFREYIANMVSGYPEMILKVSVLTPTAPIDALDALNYDAATFIFSPNILLDDLNQRKPVIIPSQAEGVEGYIIEDKYQEINVDEDSLVLVSTTSPTETVNSYADEAFRIISPLYRVDKASEVKIGMLFDFSVILKDYLLENPDAQLGRDFVMLEVDHFGNVSPVTRLINSELFVSPEAAENYLFGDNKYTYVYQYYEDAAQICFAVLEKE